MSDLHIVDRKAMFLRLVELQDKGLGVQKSRSEIANHYGITTDEVVEVESEGVKKQWPPLSSGPDSLFS